MNYLGDSATFRSHPPEASFGENQHTEIGRDGNPVGWCFVSVDDTRLSQPFKPFKAFPKKRLAALALRVRDRWKSIVLPNLSTAG